MITEPGWSVAQSQSAAPAAATEISQTPHPSLPGLPTKFIEKIGLARERRAMPFTIRVLLAAPVVGLLWIAVLAGVMLAGGTAPEALVILPPTGFAAGLPDGVAITAQGRFSLTLRSDGPGLAALLYAHGASLVLPAGLTGCLPQT